MDVEEKRELEDRIVGVLKTVFDPEIPVDIYELGLIYEIEISDNKDVKVLMTLTSPSCPVAETLPVEVEDKIKEMEDVESGKVELTFDPPWEKDMMSDEAQFELGFI